MEGEIFDEMIENLSIQAQEEELNNSPSFKDKKILLITLLFLEYFVDKFSF